MIRLCRQAGLPEPEYRQDGGLFVQTLARDWVTEETLTVLGLSEPNRRLLDVHTAFVLRQRQKSELHACSSASSRKIGCIQAGASRRSLSSAPRLSAGSVRLR